jgi:hypothetical protein
VIRIITSEDRQHYRYQEIDHPSGYRAFGERALNLAFQRSPHFRLKHGPRSKFARNIFVVHLLLSLFWLVQYQQTLIFRPERHELSDICIFFHNWADRVVAANDRIFGTTGGPVSIIIFALGGQTDGTGGADHNSCDYVTGNAIEVCASFGNSARVSALFEAELSECSKGGNLCGVSTGEALSCWCAAVIGNNALADFATAPQWAQDGMLAPVPRTRRLVPAPRAPTGQRSLIHTDLCR